MPTDLRQYYAPCALAIIALVALGAWTQHADADGGMLAAVESCDLIDMSHTYDGATVYWPGATQFKHKPVFVGRNPKFGFFYSGYDFSSAEHGGTHIDAPVHFKEGGAPVDQIPLRRLVGEACVLDIRELAAADRDYLVTEEDMRQWEAEHGTLDGCILLVYTGNEHVYHDKEQYLGSDDGTADNLHFPGLHWEAAKWMATNRQVKAVGLDTPSTDAGKTRDFKSHQVLCEHAIPGLENVMNIGRLPARGATLVMLPMKIRGGSGGPVRMLAFDNCDGGGGRPPLAYALLGVVWKAGLAAAVLWLSAVALTRWGWL